MTTARSVRGRLLVAALVGGLWTPVVAAQTRAADELRPRLLLVPRADTVFVYFAGGLTGMPRVVLTREAPGQGTREIATPVPVRDPERIEAALGAQWSTVREMARVADAADLLALIDRDPLAGAVLGALVRPVGVVTGRLAMDAGVIPGREVTYRAQFLDARGRPDGAPVVARVRVQDGPIAAPPTPRLAVSGDGIRLTFIAPRPAGVTDRVVAYVVERRVGTEPWERVVAPPVVRTFGREVAYDELAPADGRRYEWRVRGVELSGREGPPSAAVATVRVDQVAPAMPGETMARADGPRVLVTWPEAPEPDAAGYHVERAASNNGPWTRLTTSPLPVASPQWSDSLVPVRRQHFWRVRTVDRAGNVGPPGSPAPATRLDASPPPPVTGLAARPERGAMVLGWTLPANRDLLGVHIWRGEDSTRLARVTDTPLRGSAYRDGIGGPKGLTPGQSYLYRVLAVDSSRNESGPVDLRVLVPDAARPSPVTGLTATDEGGRYVELTWLPSGAADVRRYVVTRRRVREPAAGSSPANATIATIATIAAGDEPLLVRDSAISAGERYTYAVEAADSAGNRSAPVSATVEVRTAAPPPAPRYAAAERRAASNLVRWERVVAPTLAGYHVYRATGPTGPFIRVTKAPVVALTWLDAAGGASAWYEVRAVDVAGRESRSSPPARVAP